MAIHHDSRQHASIAATVLDHGGMQQISEQQSDSFSCIADCSLQKRSVKITQGEGSYSHGRYDVKIKIFNTRWH